MANIQIKDGTTNIYPNVPKIERRRVIATIPANSTSVTITATLNSNETFLLWINCVSSGWVGFVYPSDPDQQTSYIWTTSSAVSTARTVFCYYFVEVTS